MVFQNEQGWQWFHAEASSLANSSLSSVQGGTLLNSGTDVADSRQ